jgi:hypothetical protein
MAGAQDGWTRERQTAVDCDRVQCFRLGQVGLDRCRECVYLQRLELDVEGSGHVICAESSAIGDADFVW